MVLLLEMMHVLVPHLLISRSINPNIVEGTPARLLRGSLSKPLFEMGFETVHD